MSSSPRSYHLYRDEAVRLLDAAMAGSGEAKDRLFELIGRCTSPEDRDERSVFWADLVRAQTAIDAGRRVDLGKELERARELGTCEQMMVYALESQIARLRSRYRRTERLLKQAEAIGGDCPSCRAETLKRRAGFSMARGRYAEGYRYADQLVRVYTELGHPGHDFDGLGLEKALYHRGQARYFLGHHEASAREFETCLRRLPAEVDLHCKVTVGLAVALLECGTETRYEAAEIVDEVRKKRFFSDEHATSPHLARLHWLLGKLRYKLRIGKTRRARALLREALGIFVLREMSSEAAAVLSDLARVAVPRRDLDPHRALVLALLDEFAGYGLDVGGQIQARLHELRRWCDTAGWNVHEKMVVAISRLRQAAEGPGTLPCLL